MKQPTSQSSHRPWLTALLLSALAAGCGGGDGGRDPILGSGDAVVTLVPAAVAPSVTAVVPANDSTGVAINQSLITAAFSEPVSLSGRGAFTLSCAAPCVAPAGSVTFDASQQQATLELDPTAILASSTRYTATISDAKSLASGLAMTSPYVWRFTTGITADTTRPRVSLTVPATTNPGPLTGVPANTAISAVFTEAMAPGSLNAASFTLTCAAPCASPSGTVSYSEARKTAFFKPSVALTAGTTYTATVTRAATDLARNQLGGNQASLPAASNHVWTFTTAAPTAPANVSVLSTRPGSNAANVCTNASVSATFSVPSGLEMDPATVSAASFNLTGPALTPVTASSVVLDDATGRTATLTPLAPLTAGVTYTAVVKGGVNGVKDLANPANPMAANYQWTFTAVNCTQPPVPSAIVLGAASTFASYGGTAGMTNQGIDTVINGDIGTTAVSTGVTGLHDTNGNVYTVTPLNDGAVNGSIYTYPPAPGNATTKAIADAALDASQNAYNQLVAVPPGAYAGAGELGLLTLAPGTYTSATSYQLTQGDLTLDAQGDPNAVFIFQMGSSLTVGIAGPTGARSVILANGAQAKNVFWQVGTSATINGAGGGFMKGTIIAQQAVTFSTAGNAKLTVLDGRALSLISGVTMVNTRINLP
ncbi:ice-binding family protein [Polaromonas sp. CG_9.11]|uniref:ice-binding family protein n=1 Tax=Polaromonas sp. CG_9.11 TaxID=2787730 RepID=UPI0018CA2D19|nr:ice-binding family protein [Polaromonas sp. CG_9.11]MBG6076112.1 hypothetical protein [Polaromonas sp. CG_9.11]